VNIVIVSKYKIGEWGEVIGAADNWPRVLELCRDNYADERSKSRRKYTIRYCGRDGHLRNIYRENDLSDVEIIIIDETGLIGKEFKDLRTICDKRRRCE
jgi:hypothetical protein